MPAIDDLLQEIGNVLGASLSLSLTNTNDVWDVYEAYILSIVLQAAEAEGAIISYRDVNGNIPATFEFRTSPGHIYSTQLNYCHAVLSFPNKPPLEVHMSVRVAGKSLILHECDVCVLYQDEANTCRDAPNPKPDPRSSKILIAIECKFYSKPLGIGLGRSFIGLTSDLSVNNVFLVYNVSSPNLETLLTERDKARSWEHLLVPQNANKVERFKNRLQSVFQSFLSGNG